MTWRLQDVFSRALAVIVGLPLLTKAADHTGWLNLRWAEWLAILIEATCVYLLLCKSRPRRLFACYGVMSFSSASIMYHALTDHACRCLGVLERIPGDLEIIYAAVMGFAACATLVVTLRGHRSAAVPEVGAS